MAKYPAPSTDEATDEPKKKGPSISIMAISPVGGAESILDLGPEQAKTAGLSQAKKGETFTLQLEVEAADDAAEGVSLKIKDVQNLSDTMPEESMEDEEMGDDEAEESYTGKMKPRALSPSEAGLGEEDEY